MNKKIFFISMWVNNKSIYGGISLSDTSDNALKEVIKETEKKFEMKIKSVNYNILELKKSDIEKMIDFVNKEEVINENK